MGHAGHDFYLNPRRNLCVVCGVKTDLTRHHIVPQQYLRWYPDELKVGCSHDILPLCKKCHAKAEVENNYLRNELAEKYDAPSDGIGLTVNKPLMRAQRAFNTLDKYLHLIPWSKKKCLMDRVGKFFDREFDHISNTEITMMMSLPVVMKSDDYKTHGQLVIEKTEDIEGFTSMWRSYFLTSMEPEHLPRGWCVNHRVQQPPTVEAKVEFYKYIDVKDLHLGHLISAQQQIPENDDGIIMSIENKGLLWDENITRKHDEANLRGMLLDTQHFNAQDRVRFTLLKADESACVDTSNWLG